MTPERWRQVDRLLELALEQHPGERADFLTKTCAGDDELRREVEALLAAHGQAGSFIEVPALETADRVTLAAHTRLDLK
jgi:eukaryotic-like serine/threonine-protein kinase